MSKHIEFLEKLRDAGQMIADASNEYLESFAPKNIGDRSQLPAAKEENFNLKYEAMQGTKLGEYEIAHKKSNISDKWNNANAILKVNNSTIQNRYYGEGYAYSYWLYGEDKIYRQKLKPKA